MTSSFFSYWHHSIGRKWVPPRFWLNQNLLEYVKFRALKLVSIVSPLSELGIVHRFFCWIPYLPRRFMLKIHNLFQPLTNWFDWFVGAVRIQHCFLGDFGDHSSLFRSSLPHPNLELCTIFFYLLIFQGTFCQNIIIFLNWLD